MQANLRSAGKGKAEQKHGSAGQKSQRSKLKMA